jgi:GMP synthase-like glutamine amidotransferase
MLIKAVQASQIPITYLNSSLGERLTTRLTDYSHIVLLGGAPGVYQADEYAYLKYEFQLVEQALAAKLPMLGLCLGSQILARVLGAQVYPGQAGREVGWCDVSLLASALQDKLLHLFPSQFRVFQFHQDTFEIPSGCVHLAESTQYPNQAFCYQDFAWGLQFHLEMDAPVIQACAPVLEQELLASDIRNITVAQMIADAELLAPSVQTLANQLMQRFLQHQPGERDEPKLSSSEDKGLP